MFVPIQHEINWTKKHVTRRKQVIFCCGEKLITSARMISALTYDYGNRRIAYEVREEAQIWEWLVIVNQICTG